MNIEISTSKGYNAFVDKKDECKFLEEFKSLGFTPKKKGIFFGDLENFANKNICLETKVLSPYTLTRYFDCVEHKKIVCAYLRDVYVPILRYEREKITLKDCEIIQKALDDNPKNAIMLGTEEKIDYTINPSWKSFFLYGKYYGFKVGFSLK